MSLKEKDVLRAGLVEREIGETFFLLIQTPSISAPLDWPARSHFTELVPVASFSQAHSSSS